MHIAKSPLRPQKFRFSPSKDWYKLRSKEKGATKSFQLPHSVCWGRFYADIYKEDIFIIFWYSPLPWWIWDFISSPSLTKLELTEFGKKLLQIRVSNGTGQCNFLGKGTDVPSLSRDKGTTGQAKNLAKGQDVLGQPKSEMGRVGTAKNRDGTRDKTGQSRKGCSKTEKGCSKTEKDVLKQERMF